MYFLYKKFYLLYRIYYNFLFLKTKNKKCIEKDNKQVSDKIQLENHFSFQNNTLQNLYTQVEKAIYFEGGKNYSHQEHFGQHTHLSSFPYSHS